MRAEPSPTADQPEVPTPGWRTPRKAARLPRRAPLTVDAIVDAALEIVDTEGLDALSMRRVAQKLDTGAASLYAHVANKEDLIDLVLDRVSGEMSFPEPDPEHWGDQMQEGMRQVRDIYARHRDLAKANFGRIPTTPHSLEAMEGMLAVLKAGGLPDKVIAWSARPHRAVRHLRRLRNGAARTARGAESRLDGALLRTDRRVLRRAAEGTFPGLRVDAGRPDAGRRQRPFRLRARRDHARHAGLCRADARNGEA
ncbi:TetR/AcrR family transcriptional regulator C-terminal domain-containing protein [Yinghuangia aomiensis]